MTLIGRLKLLCVLMRKTSILPTLQDMVPTILFFAGYFSGDDYTDDFINLNNANTNGSGYIYFSTSATTDWNSQTGTWSGNYSVIYKANVMLEKIPGMNISDEAKRHWEGIARYFRAMAYSTLAKYYGGVPYYDKVTDPADPALYKDRDSYLM